MFDDVFNGARRFVWVVPVLFGLAARASAQPVIGGFLPAGGPPGTTVTVYGGNFDPRPFATAVTVGGAAAHAGQIDVADDGGSLTVVVPAAAVTGPIVVTTGVGTATTAGLAHPEFQVSDAPAILAMFPSSGSPGQIVQLLGHGFRNVTAVHFTGGGVALPPFAVQVDAAGSTLRAVVPGSAVSGPIVVETPTAQQSTASLEITPGDGRGVFAIGLPPTIDGFNPRTGPPGTVLTVSGRNLYETTQVRLDGAAVPILDIDDTGTAVRVTVPAGAASGVLGVETPHGTADTGALPSPAFDVDALPRIDAFYPTSGDVGTVVTLYGANFGRAAIPFPPQPSENVVHFAGVAWDVVRVDDTRTSVAVRVSAASAGSAPIQLATPAGAAVTTASFVVTNVPEIHGFEPTSGVPGTLITVLGRNLSNAHGVTFGGVPVLFPQPGEDGTWVLARVPGGAVTGPVTVSTGGGTASTGDLVPPKPFVVGAISPCGNGVLDAGETCDDGNLAPGDCCDSSCHVEAAGAVCSDDANACTTDVCDGAGTCVHTPRTGPCDDGLFCNGADTCAGGTCSQHAGDPCAGGAACDDACDESTRTCATPGGTVCPDDGDLCTVDRCDGHGGCEHVPAARTTCKRTARRASARLELSRGTGREDERLVWSLASGDATTRDDLGDPLATTSYALCVFDGDGGLLASAQAPAAGTCDGVPCWTVRHGAVRYRNPSAAAGTLASLALKPGRAGKTTGGARSHAPDLGLPPMPIQRLPVTAQLVNDAGTCWTSVFSVAADNGPTHFLARSDKPANRAAPPTAEGDRQP